MEAHGVDTGYFGSTSELLFWFNRERPCEKIKKTIRPQELILIHDIKPNFDPRKYAQFHGYVHNIAREARNISHLSLKLCVFPKVEIWPKFVDKEKFLRSEASKRMTSRGVRKTWGE